MSAVQLVQRRELACTVPAPRSGLTAKWRSCTRDFTCTKPL